MKPSNLYSTHANSSSTDSLRSPWAVWLLLSMALPCVLHSQTFSDNFNDGNDFGWSRYVPADTPPGNAPATFSFPANSPEGLAYQLFEQAPTDDTLGPARVAS